MILDILKKGGSVLLMQKAILEVSKYCVKFDFLKGMGLEGDKITKETKNVVKTLSLALKGRRLNSYGGILKEIYKELKLVEVEKSKNEELINFSEENIEFKSEVVEMTFFFSLRSYQQIFELAVLRNALKVT